MTQTHTEHLPDALQYGFVADRLLQAVGDTTSDNNRFPDGVPADGTVTFTPMKTYRYTHGVTATRVTIKPVECTYHQADDDPRKVGLLVDPAGHVGNVALVTGAYQVVTDIKGGELERFDIVVTPDHTETAPMWLAEEAPLKPSPIERFVVNERVYTEAVAARDKAEQYRNQAQTARTGAETAETNAKTHATDAASSASSAANILEATEALGITVDTSVGTRVFVGDTPIYENTGWRTLVSWNTDGELLNGSFDTIPGWAPRSGEVGSVTVLRLNNVIYYHMNGIYADSIIPRLIMPAGFNPSPSDYTNLEAYSRNAVDGDRSMRLLIGDTQVYFTASIGQYGDGTYPIAFNFISARTYPTSLPGSPA